MALDLSMGSRKRKAAWVLVQSVMEDQRLAVWSTISRGALG